MNDPNAQLGHFSDLFSRIEDRAELMSRTSSRVLLRGLNGTIFLKESLWSSDDRLRLGSFLSDVSE